MVRNQNNFNIISELKKLEKSEKRNLSAFLNAKDYSYKDGIAYQYAEHLKRKNMNTAQIRNIFSTIKEIEQENRNKSKDELINDSKKYKLLSQVAYAVGRKVVPKDFYDFMEYCVIRIENKDDLDRFVNFFEAIIAYFKYLQ